MTSKNKRTMIPITNVCHNEDDTGLEIQIDLAGAMKDSIDLDVGERGFCVKAEAEDFRYENCYMLAHEIRNKEANARFDSGLLKITVPLKDTIHGHKVTVQ